MPARAQTTVDLTIAAGSYYAISALREDASMGIEERQENMPAVGGGVTVMFTPSFGIEGSFLYTKSGTIVSGASNQNFSGNLIFADGRIRFAAPRTNLYGVLGAGIVSRSGSAWPSADFANLTDVQGLAGVGVRAAVTPSFAIDVKVEVHVYRFDPDVAGPADQFVEKTQADVIAMVGIPITLTR